MNKLSQERIKKEHRDKPKDRINAARYVQSRGVFSEGASSGTVKRSTSNNHQVDESANHISTISVPKINKANWQVKNLTSTLNTTFNKNPQRWTRSLKKKQLMDY